MITAEPSIYTTASIYNGGVGGGGGGGGNLPDGYKRLFFLRSPDNGTSTIEVNISSFNPEITGKCTFNYVVRIPQNNDAFTSILEIDPQNKATNKYIELLYSSTQFLLYYFSNNGNYPTAEANVSGSNIFASVSINGDNGASKVNGNSFASWYDPPTYKDIKAVKIIIPPAIHGDFEYYGLQIVNENNEVMYNFVPCKEIDTDKLGFFETVKEVFYEGSGYEAGPDYV